MYFSILRLHFPPFFVCPLLDLALLECKHLCTSEGKEGGGESGGVGNATRIRNCDENEKMYV